MTPEQKAMQAERAERWRHCVRQYYIQCAKTAIKLAPLPEFKGALAALECYDKHPTKENRECLKRVYRDLHQNKWGNRDYGYSAVGEFYRGLLCILYHTIHLKDSVASCLTTRFAEAYWCATRDVNLQAMFSPGERLLFMPEERAIRLAYKRHDEIWKKLFGEFHEKYGETEKEYFQKAANSADVMEG